MQRILFDEQAVRAGLTFTGQQIIFLLASHNTQPPPPEISSKNHPQRWPASSLGPDGTRASVRPPLTNRCTRPSARGTGRQPQLTRCRLSWGASGGGDIRAHLVERDDVRVCLGVPGQRRPSRLARGHCPRGLSHPKPDRLRPDRQRGAVSSTPRPHSAGQGKGRRWRACLLADGDSLDLASITDRRRLLPGDGLP